jgi:hypothetical protein
MNRAGKGDIDMVTRYFVTSRVRQAYEYSAGTALSAQEWFALGAPPTSAQVFGVTDLEIARIAGDESGDQMRYRAEYIIWIPGMVEEGEDGPAAIAAPPGSEVTAPENAAPGAAAAAGVEEFIPPRGYRFTDELTLIRHKGNWRISNINREY